MGAAIEYQSVGKEFVLSRVNGVIDINSNTFAFYSLFW